MTKFYWLLERADSPVSHPIYFATRGRDTDDDPKSHVYTWTPYAAMRFKTKADAYRYAEAFLVPGAVRVCEHGFDEGAQ